MAALNVLRGVALGAALSLASAEAHAQLDLSAEQTPTWYAVHSGVSALTLLGSWGLNESLTREASPRWTTAPGFERGTQQNDSRLAARTSDWLLVTNLALSPVGIGVAAQSGRAWANASLIDVEAVSLSLLANTLVKHTVRRARPYSQRLAASDQTGSRDAEREDADRLRHGGPEGRGDASEKGRSIESVLSFYSGHTALSTTSAVSGGLLVSALSSSEELRVGFWATQLALASLTAHLRVRAGMHYPTDVLVGGFLGAAMGVIVPLAHGVQVSVQPTELIGMGLGVGLGVGAGFLFPRRLALAALRTPLVLRSCPGGGYQLELWGRF